MKPAIFCLRCGAELQDTSIYGKVRRVCPQCDYIHFDDPKVAAAALIEQNNRVLLIRRAVAPEKGKWALPAGYVDYGEDPKQTAIREVEEETGLVIQIDHLLDVMLTHALNAVIVIVYKAYVTGGTLRPADDADDAGWFVLDELPELAFESTRIILDRWIENQL